MKLTIEQLKTREHELWIILEASEQEVKMLCADIGNGTKQLVARDGELKFLINDHTKKFHAWLKIYHQLKLL